VEIFDLRRPILSDLDLDAAAGRPAPMPVRFRYRSRRTGDAVLDIGGSAAAGDIEQPVVARVADAAAERGKPPFAHFVAKRACGRKFEGASLFARRRNIALDPEDAIAALNIVSLL